ncbi:MAG: hypothetical protein WEC59_10015 [Salibacteraceae bacterium]
MTRNDIPGQKELKDIFVKLVDDDRLPHAMLINSEVGGTSLPLALFLAGYVLCTNRKNGDACGECGNCKRIQKLEHPDVHMAVPINLTTTVKKEENRHTESFLPQLREAFSQNPFLTLQEWYKAIGIDNKQGFIGKYEGKNLRSKLALRTYEAGYRIFILWHVETMENSFSNKMLKSLEEPNEKTLFILITPTPNRLLTTIISRVQQFKEAKINDQEIIKFLIDKYKVSEHDAKVYCFRADGELNAAIKEAEHQTDTWLDEFKSWMRMAYSRDMLGLFKWSMKMAGSKRDEERHFISGSLKVLDRCFRMGWVHTEIPLEGEEAAFYKNFSPFINASNIEGFMDLLTDASFHIERNVNEKMIWFDTSIQAVRLIHEGKKVTIEESN